MPTFKVGDKVWWAHPHHRLEETVESLKPWYKNKGKYGVVIEVRPGSFNPYMIDFIEAGKFGMKESSLELYEKKIDSKPAERFKHNYIDI
jgi:hypothetical protein